MFRLSKTTNWLAGCALALTVIAVAVSSIRTSKACPFCSAINLTFAEQLDSNDIVVIARLLEVPPPATDPDADLPKAIFEIQSVLKGSEFVDKEMKFKALLVGRHEIGQDFLVMGVDPPRVAWSTPMKASERVVEYISQLGDLPTRGIKRLLFFQKYFEDKESVLAFDAYDEFARAPYEDLIAMKDHMNHEQLVAWIESPETSINRRRLYFTMLGVCGTEEDVKMLESFIKSGDRKKQAGLDALIACYLNLRGAAGVGLIEDTFLRNKEVEYVDTLAAVSALRFHGTEMEVVPKDRIVAAVRLLLDRPKMADMIIPDLARWEDWSVMEKLVQMFKDANDESNWVRVPVITYLRACPHPEAKKYIDELAKIDPDAVKRADYFLDFDDFDSSDEDESDADKEDDADKESDAEKEGDGGGAPDKGEADKGQADKGQASSTGDSGTLEATYTSLNSPVLEPGGESENSGLSDGKFVALKVPANHESDQSALETADSAPSVAENGKLANRPTPIDVPEISAESMANRSVPTDGSPQIAQAIPVPVPSLVLPSSGGTVAMVVLIPMGASAAIFLLLWSVISGWFERLIF